MTSIRTPAILFILLCLGFLLYVNQTSSLLPEGVGPHFSVDRQPNGWISRSRYEAFISSFGVGLALFVVMLWFLAQFLPGWTFNIPHQIGAGGGTRTHTSF